MNIRTLVLEDSKERMKYFFQYDFSLVHCDNTNELKKIIEKAENIEQLWLDHDLGGEIHVDSLREDCGMEIVRFLETNDFKYKIKEIFVHSHNSVANGLMVEILKNSGYNVISFPFRKFLEKVK